MITYQVLGKLKPRAELIQRPFIVYYEYDNYQVAFGTLERLKLARPDTAFIIKELDI